jgi:hypothetical protein
MRNVARAMTAPNINEVATFNARKAFAAGVAGHERTAQPLVRKKHIRSRPARF